MPKKTSRPIQKNTLRQKAEKLHSEKHKKKEPRNPASLVHELQVHQIELEMQNEELSRAKTEVEEILTKYTDLYDFAPVGYLTFDEKGLISEANLTATNLLGFERTFLINRPFHSFIERELQDRFYLYLQEVLGSSLKQTCELLLKKKDGTLFNAQLDSIAVNADGHKTVKVVLTDITERKSMEQSLKDSETRYRLLFEQSPDGIVIIDPDTARLLDFNETAHRQLGYSRDEFATLSISDLEVVETPEDIRKHMADVIREERNDFDTKHRTRHGEIRNIHVTAQLTEIQGQAVYHSIWRDITDRKLVEERLRESEAFLNTLLNTIPIPVFYKDKAGVYLGFNKAFETFFGTTKEHLVGKSVFDISPLELAQVYQRKDKEMLASKETQQYETQVRNTQGSLRDVVFNKAVFTDSRGVVGGLVGTVLDITERKRTEEQLREREEMMRHIIQYDPNAIAIYDRNLHYIAVSNRYLQDYAIEEADVLGKHHYEVFPEMPQKWKDVHQRCLAGAIERNDDDYFERPDGSITYNRWECRPWYDASGQIGGIVTYTEVTTERKKAEKALRESEEQFRKMFEESPLGKVMVNSDFHFVRVNTAFCHMLGYTEQELLSLTLKDITHPDHIEGDITRVNDLLNGKISLYRTEKRYVRKDKTIMWGSTVINTIRGEDNRFLYLLGAIEDITEKKHAEEMLIDLFKDLEKKNAELEKTYDKLRESQQKIIQQEKMASIGQIAAGVAHEINNPVAFVMSNINSMGKYSERLSQFIKIQSEAIEKLSEAGDAAGVLESLHKKRRALKIDYVANDLTNVIKESLEGTKRVKRIVQDLKSFSHKDESMHRFADINDGIESTINVVWNELKYKADVKKEYGKIPLTKCNIGQLNQVFMNLLVNAAHAIEKHGEITVKTELKDGDIVVSVSDTGSGIPNDKINRIFEPFFTTKEVGEGTGLGLSIAYDIVKKHNGEILVTSEIGKGTTFTVTIPVAED